MLIERKRVFPVFIIFVLGLWSWCSADMFSATYKMEHLLETRQRVIDDLEAYIHKEEDRLRDLKLYLNLYKREQKIALKDGSKYVGNPINAFILIKRLTADLDDIEGRINQTTEYVSIRNMTVDDNDSTILYPTSDDLDGAGLALRRLQKTYKLSVEDVANGVINGAFYGQPLSAHDCYILGTIVFARKYFKTALAWHMEALRKFKLEDDTIPRPITIINILEYIGICHYRMGDPELAAEWTLKILKLDPTNKRAKRNLMAYERIISVNENPQVIIQNDNKNKTNTIRKEDNNGMKNGTSSQDTVAKYGHFNNVTNNTSDAKKATHGKNEAMNVTKDKENVKAEMLSNSEDNKTVADATSKNGTKASDSTDTNKTESQVGNEMKNETNSTAQFNDDKSLGDIENAFVEYRQNMLAYTASCRGDYDIAPEMSHRLSCRYANDKPFLKLAPIKLEQLYINPDAFLVYDVISDGEIEQIKSSTKSSFRRSKTGDEAKLADDRISQNTWLRNNNSDVVSVLLQRISDFTGLRTESSESLEIINYGLGGHYEPHLDISLNPKSPQSDRFVTVMFYMSDVALGGETVFPKLGLSVYPVKGAAVYWMNLFSSGKGNTNSLHAGCPVVDGSKWLALKLISFRGQLLNTPCNRDYEIEETVSCPAPILKSKTHEFLK